MNLIPWRQSGIERRSVNPMQSLQQDIDRLFEQFMQAPLLPDVANWPTATMAFYPRMDIKETDTGIELSAELPGMTEKDIDISVDNGALIVRGEKKTESDRASGNWRVTERSYGKFERSIDLGSDLDGDKAQASFKHGVLSVTVPRKEGVKRNVRKIKVAAEH
jgi:HSP20 family protein